MRAVSFAAVIALAAVVAVQGVSIHHLHQQALSAGAAAQTGAVAISANGDGAGASAPAAPFVIPQYIPPTPADCRSPCPALNTLANHGLLPRNGKDIDYAQLKEALIGVYNLGSTFGFVFARAATKKFADPKTGKFSLCDLLINVHNNAQPSGSTGIEHSASMSREDRPSMDFSHKNDATQRSPSRAQVDLTLRKTSAGDMFTLNDFVNARKTLWAKSYSKLPALEKDPLNKQEHIIADVEGCLLLGALSGNSNGGSFQISKNYANSFLFAEQFPKGWDRSPNALGIPQLMACLAGQGFEWAKNEWSGLVELSKHWFGME